MMPRERYWCPTTSRWQGSTHVVGVLLRFTFLLFATSSAHAESSTWSRETDRRKLISVDRSYAFHLEPRATLKSVLSISRQELRRANEEPEKIGKIILKVNVSSSRLGDGDALALMDGLLSVVRAEGGQDVVNATVNSTDAAIILDEMNSQITPSKHPYKNGSGSLIFLRLAVRMNRLTSTGAADLLGVMHRELQQGQNFAHVVTDRTPVANGGGEKEKYGKAFDDEDVASKDILSLVLLPDEGSDTNKSTKESADKVIDETDDDFKESKGNCATEMKGNRDQPSVNENSPLTTNYCAPSSTVIIDELDFSFNDIGGHGTHPTNARLLHALRKIFESSINSPSTGDWSLASDAGPKMHTPMIPRVLALECCSIGPAICRAIGRGILDGAENESTRSGKGQNGRLAVLRLAGNRAIGDAGTVALAAAFRLAVPSSPSVLDQEVGDDKGRQDNTAKVVKCCLLMEELNLASCDVGDAGAEALALALLSNPGCLARLDLSNNKVTDEGAEAIGRALVEAHRMRHASYYMSSDVSSVILDHIQLDNNAGVGDRGASALAEALACGAVRSVSMRSCSVRAEGAAAFGRALVSIAKKNRQQQSQNCIGIAPNELHIDLSGNRLGTVKVEKKKGAAYSASLIRSKASSHMSLIGKTIQNRLKDAGMSVGVTAESDNDEEKMMDMDGILDAEVDEKCLALQASTSRCGARSFSENFLHVSAQLQKDSWCCRNDRDTLECILGLRRCALDAGATYALSASVVGAEKLGINLSIDASLNTGINEEYSSALRGDVAAKGVLREMAKNHADALEVIHQARQRASFAAEAAAVRMNAEMELNGVMFNEDPFGIPDDSECDPYNSY